MATLAFGIRRIMLRSTSTLTSIPSWVTHPDFASRVIKAFPVRKRERFAPAAAMPFLDKRAKALAVFASNFRSLNLVTNVPGDRRAPVFCNTGFSGSGKTAQLQLLCDSVQSDQFFENHKVRFHALYFTNNEELGYANSIDQHCSIDTRVGHRLLHAAVDRKVWFSFVFFCLVS